MHIHISVEEVDSNYKNYKVLQKKGYEYVLELFGFQPNGCLTFHSKKIPVFSLDDIELNAINLILDLAVDE